MPQVTQRAILPTSRTAPAPTATVEAIPAAAQKQPHTPESPNPATAEATAATPAQDAISPKIAALARRERALLDGQRQIEAQKQAVEAQREEIKRQAQAEIRARLKQDPFSLMDEEGLTLEQMLDLQSKRPTPEAQKLSLLEQRLAKLDQDKVDEQQRNYQAARTQALTDVKQVVTASPEFEVIKALGLEEQVVSKIEEGFKKTNTLMDYAQACKEIEEEYFPLALEIAKLAKVQKALLPPAATEQPQPQDVKTPVATQKQPAMTTLSNRQAAGSKKSTSWSEHRARLIAIAEGKSV